MYRIDIVLQGRHMLASVHIAIGTHIDLLIIVNQQISGVAATAHHDVQDTSAGFWNVLL